MKLPPDGAWGVSYSLIVTLTPGLAFQCCRFAYLERRLLDGVTIDLEALCNPIRENTVF